MTVIFRTAIMPRRGTSEDGNDGHFQDSEERAEWRDLASRPPRPRSLDFVRKLTPLGMTGDVARSRVYSEPVEGLGMTG